MHVCTSHYKHRLALRRLVSALNGSQPDGDHDRSTKGMLASRHGSVRYTLQPVSDVQQKKATDAALFLEGVAIMCPQKLTGLTVLTLWLFIHSESHKKTERGNREESLTATMHTRGMGSLHSLQTPSCGSPCSGNFQCDFTCPVCHSQAGRSFCAGYQDKSAPLAPSSSQARLFGRQLALPNRTLSIVDKARNRTVVANLCFKSQATEAVPFVLFLHGGGPFAVDSPVHMHTVKRGSMHDAPVADRGWGASRSTHTL